MQLTLTSREVGSVTVVNCKGRIIAGSESESLRSHVAWLLHSRHSIVLNLHDVTFIDSSGLGTMVRILSSVRQARGALKLCDVPELVRKLLDMTRLTTIFDSYHSEEIAVTAFYEPGARIEPQVSAGRRVLCIDSNVDVLAYLRELLRGAGYDAQSSSRLSDAMLLVRVTHFDLLLLGPDKLPTAASPQSFRDACARVPVIELDNSFSIRDAGEAGTALLETIALRLAQAS